MPTPLYPIYSQPTDAFMARLKKEQDPQWVVTGLEFVQWGKNLFGAKWEQGQKGRRFTAEMELGGKEPTLAAIEERVINALKRGGTI
jgi:hypothetical protein